MNKKLYCYFGLTIITVVCVIGLCIMYPSKRGEVLLAFVPPVIIAIVIEFTAPDRNKVVTKIHQVDDLVNNCTILLLGIAGTGKTSLAKLWDFEDADNQISTKSFQVYTKREEKFQIDLIDYRGQSFLSLIDNLGDFKQNISVAIFVVDIVPRDVIVDGETEKLDSRFSQVQWLLTRYPYQEINKRAGSHFPFFGVAGLQQIFQAIYSLKLRRVLFLINKIDILEDETLLAKLPPKFRTNTKESVRKLFVDFESQLKQFCQRQPIPIQFEVEFIGVFQNHNTQKIYKKIKYEYNIWREEISRLVKLNR